MHIDVSILTRRSLPRATVERMFALHRRSFDGTTRQRFGKDLAEKDWVITLSTTAGELVGFSTQQLLTVRVAERQSLFLFSGDTVVDQRHWNTPGLAGAFGHLMLALIAQHGERDLFWFLISKGYRTYRFLPVFFRTFWPSPQHPTPSSAAVWLHAVARSKFGAAYDPHSGIVRPVDGDRLTPALAEVPAGRRADAHVSYFCGRNPGHAQGEELACLAPIRRDNFNVRAWRVIQATRVHWSEGTPEATVRHGQAACNAL